MSVLHQVGARAGLLISIGPAEARHLLIIAIFDDVLDVVCQRFAS